MSLTPEQSKIVQEIYKWIADGKKWNYNLGGYAGTGKTYTIQEFVNNASGIKIICCAPTGKAVDVLNKKMPGAFVSTIHSLLYVPITPSSELLDSLMKQVILDPANLELREALAAERKKLAKKKISFANSPEPRIPNGAIVVVDESSMVTNRMYADFKATGNKVLFVGDPGQLPPVGDSETWFTEKNMDGMLHKIQRQAQDNPIIRLSMEIRGNRPIKYQRYYKVYPNCNIMHKSEVDHQQWIDADQVITGRNVSRQRINRFVRKKMRLNDSPLPRAGEKLIFLKNELVDDIYYINGMQCTAMSDAQMGIGEHPFIDVAFGNVFVDAVPFYDYHCASHYDKSLELMPWSHRRDARELDYAYAITVHKAQGSEWNSVLISDDNMLEHRRKFRRQWMYTAVTRAKNKLLWVQD